MKPRSKHDDRIGLWLKHRQTGEVYVIADVFRTNDGFNECGVYYLADKYDYRTRVNYDKYERLFDKYEHCPTAQLLYGNKVGDNK